MRKPAACALLAAAVLTTAPALIAQVPATGADSSSSVLVERYVESSNVTSANINIGAVTIAPTDACASTSLIRLDTSPPFSSALDITELLTQLLGDPDNLNATYARPNDEVVITFDCDVDVTTGGATVYLYDASNPERHPAEYLDVVVADRLATVNFGSLGQGSYFAVLVSPGSDRSTVTVAIEAIEVRPLFGSRPPGGIGPVPQPDPEPTPPSAEAPAEPTESPTATAPGTTSPPTPSSTPTPQPSTQPSTQPPVSPTHPVNPAQPPSQPAPAPSAGAGHTPSAPAPTESVWPGTAVPPPESSQPPSARQDDASSIPPPSESREPLGPTSTWPGWSSSPDEDVVTEFPGWYVVPSMPQDTSENEPSDLGDSGYVLRPEGPTKTGESVGPLKPQDEAHTPTELPVLVVDDARNGTLRDGNETLLLGVAAGVVLVIGGVAFAIYRLR